MAAIETPIDLESPDLTGFVVPIDAKRYIEYYHQELRQLIENRLSSKWHVVSIEQRPETTYAPMKATQTDESPVYTTSQILATFDIIAVEDGPVARIVDEQFVPVHRRKLRLKGELDEDGHVKIVESDVDAPKRRGGF